MSDIKKNNKKKNNDDLNQGVDERHLIEGAAITKDQSHLDEQSDAILSVTPNTQTSPVTSSAQDQTIQATVDASGDGQAPLSLISNLDNAPSDFRMSFSIE